MTGGRDAAAGGGSTGGYTLIEVLVTLALLVTIAVILVPILFTSGGGERVAEADVELKAVTDAMDAFYEDVSEWPTNLGQLTSPIVGGDRDVCGDTYNGGERNRWAGPYLTTVVPAGGLPVGIGTLQPTFTWTDGGGLGVDLLGMVVTGVEENDAIALDDQVDGDGDPGGGTVRWSAPSGGQVTLTWTIPITTC